MIDRVSEYLGLENKLRSDKLNYFKLENIPAILKQWLSFFVAMALFYL